MRAFEFDSKGPAVETIDGLEHLHWASKTDPNGLLNR